MYPCTTWACTELLKAHDLVRRRYSWSSEWNYVRLDPFICPARYSVYKTSAAMSKGENSVSGGFLVVEIRKKYCHRPSLVQGRGHLSVAPSSRFNDSNADGYGDFPG